MKPTFEDIVLLNALGLKVERKGDEYNFAACPRVAFLGDYTLFEPTVGKRIWMDTASQLLEDDWQTQLYFTAWCLNCPDDELPKMDDVKNIVGEVKKFATEVLVNHTITQVTMAIDYALNGSDPRTGEDYTDADKSQFEDVYEVPQSVLSASRQILNEALLYGMDEKVKDATTLPQLERMVVCAAMSKGADILKEQHTQDAAKFYAACGKIHTRLLDEVKANG